MTAFMTIVIKASSKQVVIDYKFFKRF